VRLHGNLAHRGKEGFDVLGRIVERERRTHRGLETENVARSAERNHGRRAPRSLPCRAPCRRRHAVEHERHNPGALARSADEAQARDRPQSRDRLLEQLMLVERDPFQVDAVEIVDRRAETDRVADVSASGPASRSGQSRAGVSRGLEPECA
jgi:hypothetical protein